MQIEDCEWENWVARFLFDFLSLVASPPQPQCNSIYTFSERDPRQPWIIWASWAIFIPRHRRQLIQSFNGVLLFGLEWLEDPSTGELASGFHLEFCLSESFSSRREIKFTSKQQLKLKFGVMRMTPSIFYQNLCSKLLVTQKKQCLPLCGVLSEQNFPWRRVLWEIFPIKIFLSFF